VATSERAHHVVATGPQPAVDAAVARRRPPIRAPRPTVRAPTGSYGTQTPDRRRRGAASHGHKIRPAFRRTGRRPTRPRSTRRPSTTPARRSHRPTRVWPLPTPAQLGLWAPVPKVWAHRGRRGGRCAASVSAGRSAVWAPGSPGC